MSNFQKTCLLRYHRLNPDDVTDDLELVGQVPKFAASDSRQTSIDASVSRSGPVGPKGYGDYFKTIGRFGLDLERIRTTRSAQAKLDSPNEAIMKLATSNKLVSPRARVVPDTIL